MEHFDRDVTLRRDMGWVLAFGHFMLFLLATFGRLEYTVLPRDNAVGVLADSWGWGPIHAIVFVAIIATYTLHRGESLATGASTGAFVVWSVLNGLWAFEAVHPVSLVPPVLGIVIAALGWRLTRSWEDNRDDSVV